MKEPYKTDPDDMTKVYIDEKTSVRRHIVCAANKFKCGTVVCGARHWDSVMLDVVTKLGIEINEDHEQGFIDQYEQFVSREEAAIIVKANNQKLTVSNVGQLLISESLY